MLAGVDDEDGVAFAVNSDNVLSNNIDTTMKHAC